MLSTCDSGVPCQWWVMRVGAPFWGLATCAFTVITNIRLSIAVSICLMIRLFGDDGIILFVEADTFEIIDQGDEVA